MSSLALRAPSIALAHDVMATHSKSFTVASRLLDAKTRGSVAVLYAWCRRADDAIDSSPASEQAARLADLRVALDSLYAGQLQRDPLLHEVQRVFQEHEMPSEYPRLLLDGMEMDVRGQHYRTWSELDTYCYRVAGVVGVMLCHVFGVSSKTALRHAAHLGMAMQLTNICRDVSEDWQRGRLYIPDELLAVSGAGGLRSALGGPLPVHAQQALARAVAELLAQAERWYRSADSALTKLPFRAQLATRAARLVYSQIGEQLAARDYDVFGPRVVVSRSEKAKLVLRALCGSLAALPSAFGFRAQRLRGVLRYPDDVLP